MLSLVKQGVASGGTALCKCYREFKRLHWAASTPCHAPLPLTGRGVRAWRVRHLLLPRSSAFLAHIAFNALVHVAWNILAGTASPWANRCTLCASTWAGPLSACGEDVWHIFPNTEAKVLWLNILVLEIRHHRGLIPLLRKEMSRSGVCSWEEWGGVKSLWQIFPSFCWIMAK